MEDVRSAIIASSVNAPKGSFDGARQSYAINANDQIFSADDYKNVIIAYKNGAPFASAIWATLDIANARYQSGVEQHLDVITAQTIELTHEETVIQLRGQRLAASVALIKSLGAGWSVENVSK